jgi:hypothetical protein
MHIIAYTSYSHPITVQEGVIIAAVGVICLVVSLDTVYGGFRKRQLRMLGIGLTFLGVAVALYAHFFGSAGY